MCGRVRLGSDHSDIKIRMKFAPNSVAPNFERHPSLGQRRQNGLLNLQRKISGIRYQARLQGSVEIRATLSRGYRGFVSGRSSISKGKEKQPNAIGMANGEQMVKAGLWSKWRNPASVKKFCRYRTPEVRRAPRPLLPTVVLCCFGRIVPDALRESCFADQGNVKINLQGSLPNPQKLAIPKPLPNRKNSQPSLCRLITDD
jgi:hypothetical protein